MADAVISLADAAEKALGRLVREVLARRPGGHLVEARVEELRVRVPLGPDGSHADSGARARTLVDDVERIVDEAIRRAAAFRPGRAPCHRCGEADCPHARPPSCRHVFVGYTPTGTPEWVDFAQHALDIRHPDVDRLYDEPPAFVTVIQAGEDLRRRLLPAFRTASYDVEGQVLAGFFPVRTREDEGRGVLALTFQVVASHGPDGPSRWALNILGRAPGGEDLETLWDRYREVPWRRAVRWAQSAVASLRPAARTDARIEGILRGLARRLEHDLRARARRTGHAERRHESGQRPTRKALDDVRDAAEEAFLVDERRGTVVVLGERGRTHFFAPEGRLVSSVRYSRDAIERKRKLGLWRAADRDEVDRIRRRLLDARS